MTRPAGRVGEVAVRAPQERLDPAQELAQAERLREVVVRTELETDDLVDLVVTGGQHEDRHLGTGRADAAQRLEAVDAGEAHVEDDQVRGLAGRDLQALLAGSGDADVVALLLQGVLDPARDGVLVFDDQDGGGHAPDATPALDGGLRPALPSAVTRPGGAATRRWPRLDANERWTLVVPYAPAPGASPSPAPPASRSPTSPTSSPEVHIPWPPPVPHSPPSTVR